MTGEPPSSDGLDGTPHIFLPQASLPMVHSEMLVVPAIDRGAFSLSTPSVNKNRLEGSGHSGNSHKEIVPPLKVFREMSFGVLKKNFFILGAQGKITGESGVLCLGIYIIGYISKACASYNWPLISFFSLPFFHLLLPLFRPVYFSLSLYLCLCLYLSLTVNDIWDLCWDIKYTF